MTSRLVALCVDARDPGLLAGFWAGLLGRDPVADGAAVSLPGTRTQVGLRFVPNPAEKPGRNRIHLHLTSSSLADQRQRVDHALHLGGTHLDVGQRPEEEHVVLADPENNEFCVIEPGNSFLAGCGLLGELACEGTRDVGLFWSEALGWPLVWDRDGETAVQAPEGGTKVAWGGPPVPVKVGRNRLRFELAPGDIDQLSEADRLLALGAILLERTDDGTVILADPDGNEFSLLPH